MKNTKNSAALPVARNITSHDTGTDGLPVLRKRKGEDPLGFDLRQRRAHYEFNQARYYECAKKVVITLPAPDYGLLVAGATHHGTTVEDLLQILINREVCDWSNDAFAIYLGD